MNKKIPFTTLCLCAFACMHLSAQKADYGYLYCHMSGRGEWTAYALSRDGIHFHDLIGGDAVYDTEKLSQIEGGARDAYICRAADGKSFVMTTTDMCVKKSKTWFNSGINLLKSPDLISWTSVTFDFRKGPAIFCDPESPDVYQDYSAICRVWAPQVIWDKDYAWADGAKGGYMVYYSLLNDKEDKYDRVFYSYADRSFTKLTKPRLLVDWGYATIDADISYVKKDSLFHMLIKKEGGKRGIFTSTSASLTGPYPQPDEGDYVSFEGNKQCEGASAFQLIGDPTWRVAYVEYSSRPAKYRICRADEYLRNFHSPEDIQGVANPQHGSFVTLTKEEYERLEEWSAKAGATPDSAYLSIENRNGLYLRWSIDRETQHNIDYRFLASDYGRWGSGKKMYKPTLYQENGMWICEFYVTEKEDVYARTASEDLIHWKPQDYFLSEKNIPLYEKKGGVELKVPFPVIQNLINHAELKASQGKLYAETAKDDDARFAGLEDVEVLVKILPEKRKKISDMLIGVFFEDISYAADGGLYAELVQNRDFEYSGKDKRGWSAATAWKAERGALKIDTAAPLHPNNPHYAVLKNGEKLTNEGFDGIAIAKGEKYDFSVFARGEGRGSITVRLVDTNGNAVSSEAEVKITSKSWEKYPATLTASQTVKDARLEIAARAAGSSRLAADMISLFPQKTFKNRKNGLRADLAQAIADLKPRFVRFPGGCVAHGDGVENIYRWKNTIGAPEERVPQRNIWNYHQTAGLGYYEYFQFCEDIGAEPLPVLAAGVPCQNSGGVVHGLAGQQGGIPMDEMDEYVQEILDLIEWANGDATTTKWGKIRAQAGHPAPFNLKYIGVGNEDLISDVFKKRFEMIFSAIREKYPEITVIGTVGPFYEGADYDEGWRFAAQLGVPMVDEHYYVSPGWFIYNQDYYDKYDRSKPKVYLGEYAAHLQGRPNNMETALAEALHLCNVERNGDVVAMTSYAPLLAKDEHKSWTPNLIYFNNTEVRPTTDYYVQQLFGQNSGDVYLSSEVSVSSRRDAVRKRIAFSAVQDSRTGDYIVKLVNLLPVKAKIKLDAGSLPLSNREATVSVLSGSPTDASVKPVTQPYAIGSEAEIPPYSFVVVRVGAEK